MPEHYAKDSAGTSWASTAPRRMRRSRRSDVVLRGSGSSTISSRVPTSGLTARHSTIPRGIPASPAIGVPGYPAV